MHKKSESKMRIERIIELGIMIALILTSLNITNAQVIATSILEINQDLDNWTGAYVEISGIFISTGEVVELWINSREPAENHRFNWDLHVVLADSGAMPANPQDNQGDSVKVTGYVEKYFFDYPPVGDAWIGRIKINSLTVLKDGTEQKSFVPDYPFYSKAAGCDSCKFAILVSGYNYDDYWNDLLMKYEYKKNNEKLCPENIVVLFKGGSKNTGQIANGTTGTGGELTSGGVFDCNRGNLDKAFDYIKKKMKDNKCQPAEFQFHSTGHGSGYHTEETQNGRTEASGFAGGMLDTNGDEKNKINENDLKFSYRGEYDLDGDGKKDIKIDRINNPNPPPTKIIRVRQDKNNDGTWETTIGTDTNEDGRVDKDDTNWSAPDLNKNNTVDDVGWDDVLQLGGGNKITDDELRGKIKDLIDNTGLSHENSRAELSQCFSGSFLDDLQDVSTEACSACKPGEVSLSKRGTTGYNFYQKYFIDGLKSGKSWYTAHHNAVDSLKTKNIDEDPQYQETYQMTFVKYCQWHYVSICPGKTMTFKFPKDPKRCFNCTVYEMNEMDWLIFKHKTWNFNSGKTRTFVNNTNMPKLLLIHNDDYYIRTHGALNKTEQAYPPYTVSYALCLSEQGDETTPDNGNEWGGFSLGGDDDMDMEFGEITTSKATYDDFLFNDILKAPNGMSPTKVTNYTITHTISEWNSYWTDLGLVLGIATVTIPGKLIVQSTATGFKDTLDIQYPGEKMVTIGGVQQAGVFDLNFQIIGNTEFTFDNIGVPSLVPIIPSSVKDNNNTPGQFNLNQNYPNPFNTGTTIGFQVPKTSRVRVHIYNVLGKRVCTLTDKQYNKGFHNLHWDGRNNHGHDVSSGIYLIQLQAEKFTQVKRMCLIR
jgi:hypothetical protein